MVAIRTLLDEFPGSIENVEMFALIFNIWWLHLLLAFTLDSHGLHALYILVFFGNDGYNVVPSYCSGP